MHPHVEVADARLSHRATDPKVVLHRVWQVREIRLADRRGRREPRDRLFDVALGNWARRLKGPSAMNPNTTPASAITFANAPTLASAHDVTTRAMDRAIAQAPIAHHQRGQTKIDIAAATKRHAAISHITPIVADTGRVNWGSVASPNALANPRR